MKKLELIDDLILRAEGLSAHDETELDALRRRIVMVVRRVFGESSPYLQDLAEIEFSGSASGETVAKSWSIAHSQLINFLQTLRDDVELFGAEDEVSDISEPIIVPQMQQQSPPIKPDVERKEVEVSSRSWFGRPSQMDKTIKKWTDRKWTLADKRQLDANRYMLTFELSAAEAAKKRRQRLLYIGGGVFFCICVGIMAISTSIQEQQERETQTYVAQVTNTFRAEAQATERQEAINATATATLWTSTYTPTATDTPTSTLTPTETHTPSSTPTASNTFTPSNTPIVSNTPFPTDTLTATLTPTSTNTSRPTSTLRRTSTPQLSSVTYYIAGSGTVNARECPRTSCSIATTFLAGDTVNVVSTVDGERTLGSNEWREIDYQGETVYVHSSLTSRTRPATRVPVTRPPQSTQPPVSTQAPGFACNCSKTCTQMVSCEEAYYQLNQCGCQQRDSDDDGVPCESICPGG